MSLNRFLEDNPGDAAPTLAKDRPTPRQLAHFIAKTEQAPDTPFAGT